MDVQIALINSRNPSSDKSGGAKLPKTIIYRYTGTSDIISDVKKQVADITGVSENSVKLIFSGKSLQDSAPLDSLNVGPATIIHAVISNGQDENQTTGPQKDCKVVTDDKDLSDQNMSCTSYFFVYCKDKCHDFGRGKLRVRCSECKSTAVVLLQEPSSWADVLAVKLLKAECFGNKCEESYGEFYFKCFSCSQLLPADINCTATPLPQIKSNIARQTCQVCNELVTPVFDFMCLPDAHVICIDCFKAYVTTALNDRRFRMHATHGYSLSCPVAGCDSWVTDPHHFRLLGEENYCRFKQLGAEACLMQLNGVFCPKPGCGTGFTVEGSDTMNTVVMCPECQLIFCRVCRQNGSSCFCRETESVAPVRDIPDDATLSSGNKESMSTIKKICHNCPRCRVSTEKNGGCNHMTCTQCGFGWCWICVAQWTDDCQWDHWFE